MKRAALAAVGGSVGALGDLLVAYAAQDYVGLFIAGLGLVPLEGWQVLASGLAAAAAVGALIGAFAAKSAD